MLSGKLNVRMKDMLVLLICFVTSACVFFFNTHDFNKISSILPITFGLCYITVLAPIRYKSRSKTVMWFSIAEFIRLVFVPCFESVNEYVGFYGFSTQDVSLISRAVFLMSYECVFLSIFLLFVLSTKNNSIIRYKDNETIIPLGSDRMTLFFVLLTGVILYIVIPEVNRYINILFLKSNSEKVRGLVAGTRSTLDVGLVSFAYYSLLCGFIIAIDYAKNKYDMAEKVRYMLFASIVGLFFVSIINGESRSITVFTLYAVIECLRICFKKYREFITRVFVFGGMTVLAGMTVYRLFAVYKYSSYTEALKGASLRENYFQSFVEMYFLGPQSIACGLQFSDIIGSKLSVSNFFYDIFRSFLGFNFIAKLFDVNTSIQLFNSWFSGIEGKSNGLYFQISNQGYCYFGYILAPIFACVFLGIAILLEKMLNKPNTLFMIFFYNYVLIRAATCVIAGTMSDYISSFSRTLIMVGFIYFLQRMMRPTVRSV